MKHFPFVYPLPEGREVTLEWLTPEELDHLLTIPTTVKQAEQIRKRNQSLALNLETILDSYGNEYTTTIGCPHCMDVCCNCDSCAWRSLASHMNHSSYFCLWQTFSGLTSNETVIGYGTYSEGSYSCPDKIMEQSRETRRDNALCLLNGHLEWAKAVILCNGTA